MTTTTPRVITKVETVTWKVWHVAPPSYFDARGRHEPELQDSQRPEIYDQRIRDRRVRTEEGHDGFGPEGYRSAGDGCYSAGKADWNNAAASAGTQAGCAGPDRYGGAETSASCRRSQGRTSTQKTAKDRQRTAARRCAWCTVLRVGVDGHDNPKVRCLIHYVKIV